MYEALALACVIGAFVAMFLQLGILIACIYRSVVWPRYADTLAPYAILCGFAAIVCVIMASAFFFARLAFG